MPVPPLHSWTHIFTSEGVPPLISIEKVTVDTGGGDAGEEMISPNVAPVSAAEQTVAPKTLSITMDRINFFPFFIFLLSPSNFFR